MGLRDDIVRFFQSLIGDTTVDVSRSVFDVVLDSFWTILFFVLIGIVIFIVWRAIRQFTSYAGAGEELGSFKLHIMKRTVVKGNLNINELAINDGTIETILNSIKELKMGIEEIQKLYNSGKFFIYDFRITDYDEISWDIKGGKDSIVLSPFKIESEDFSWQDTKGDRSIISPSFRLKSKNVFCWESSEYLPDLEDPYGDLFDAYILTPIPRTLTQKLVKAGSPEEASMELHKIVSGKELALAVSYMPTIAESWKRIVPNEKEIERLRKLVLDKDTEASDLFREVEDMRHLAYPHPLIGHPQKQKPFEKYSHMIWVLVGGIMGGIGYGLPDFIPQLSSISPIITMGVGLIIAVSLYKISEDSRKKELDSVYTTENENV